MSTNIFSRFVNGMKISYKSFSFFNRKIVLYCIIPLLTLLCTLGILTKLIPNILISNVLMGNYNGFFSIIILPFLAFLSILQIPTDLIPDIQFSDLLFKHHSYWIFLLITLFITELTLVFIKIALAHNINITMHEKDLITYKNPFKPKIKNGIIWASISCILVAFLATTYFIFQAFFLNHIILTYIFIALAFITWTIITSFVIQAITIDNLGIFSSIKKSILMFFDSFFEYLGVIFGAILLQITTAIAHFAISLFWLFNVIFYNASPYESSEPEILLTVFVNITAIIMFFYVYENSKTLLYNEFKQKNI